MWKELQLSAPARLLNAFQAHAPFTTAAATTGSGDESTLRLRGTSRRRAPRCARSSGSPWLPRPVSKPAYPRESVRKLWASVVDNEQSVGLGVIAADPIAGKRQRVVPRGDSRGARSKLIQNLKVIKRIRVRIGDARVDVVVVIASCCLLLLSSLLMMIYIHDVWPKNTYVPTRRTTSRYFCTCTSSL